MHSACKVYQTFEVQYTFSSSKKLLPISSHIQYNDCAECYWHVTLRDLGTGLVFIFLLPSTPANILNTWYRAWLEKACRSPDNCVTVTDRSRRFIQSALES